MNEQRPWTIVREEVGKPVDARFDGMERMATGFEPMAWRLDGIETRLGKMISENGQAVRDLKERVARQEGEGEEWK